MAEVANNFEAMMLDMLMRQMRQAGQFAEADGDSPFAPSNAEKIYRDMLDGELTKSLSKTRPVGYGDMVARQLRGETGIPRESRRQAQAAAQAKAQVPGKEQAHGHQ